MKTDNGTFQLPLGIGLGILLFALTVNNGVHAEENFESFHPDRTIDSRNEHSAPDLTIRAMSLIGTPYRHGGNSPEAGLDCSGLVRYLFRETWGTELPRTAEQISTLGQHIDSSELQPGDLVFYNTLRRAFSHVGIYLGDGKFIHAPASGGKVRIEDMRFDYWKRRFNGARRILQQPQ